ncbi:MAG: pilus assembly protein [Proteobacteria bacterium]|nr:pilus assembly protein [Pseudomonadota bacterium]
MLVEVVLILPVFLYLVFSIMEIGHLAFRSILIHHAAYEVARIGSLTTTPVGQACKPGFHPALNINKMRQVALRILPTARMTATPVPTLFDPQADCMNHDVVVQLTQDVPLVFPMTGLIFGTPRGNRQRRMNAAVRMPIERPLFK